MVKVLPRMFFAVLCLASLLFPAAASAKKNPHDKQVASLYRVLAAGVNETHSAWKSAYPSARQASIASSSAAAELCLPAFTAASPGQLMDPLSSSLYDPYGALLAGAFALANSSGDQEIRQARQTLLFENAYPIADTIWQSMAKPTAKARRLTRGIYAYQRLVSQWASFSTSTSELCQAAESWMSGGWDPQKTPRTLIRAISSVYPASAVSESDHRRLHSLAVSLRAYGASKAAAHAFEMGFPVPELSGYGSVDQDNALLQALYGSSRPAVSLPGF